MFRMTTVQISPTIVKTEIESFTLKYSRYACSFWKLAVTFEEHSGGEF